MWDTTFAWLQVFLAIGISAGLTTLTGYALMMDHTKWWVAILIKVLAMAVLIWGIYEGVATTYALLARA